MELLTIESELAGPEKQRALVKYDDVLVGLQARAKDALRIGLPSDEFAKVSALDDVVTVARKLLRLQIRDEK